MDNNRIIELLARKQANEATPRELEELNTLMNSFPDAMYFDEIVSEIWAQREDMARMDEGELDVFYQAHKIKFSEELGFKNQEGSVPVHSLAAQEKPIASENAVTAENPITHQSPSTPQNPESFVLKSVNLSSWIKNHYSLLGVACGIFIVAMASFFYLKNNPKEFDTQVWSGKGMRKKILLPDGTLVWLNAESSLSYDSHLDEEDKRVVYLTGEAFFDVAHRLNKPFIVRTQELSVKVLGTAFNVKAYAKERGTEATLLRGSIELSMNDQPAQKIVLKPSEKFVTATQKKSNLDKNGNQEGHTPHELFVEQVIPVRISGSEYIEETSWKDNMLVFQNESLEDLKPRLERWFNVHIELSSTLPKSYRFTGVLKNENIKEALTAMQLIKPFHFKQKADDVIIY